MTRSCDRSTTSRRTASSTLSAVIASGSVPLLVAQPPKSGRDCSSQSARSATKRLAGRTARVCPSRGHPICLAFQEPVDRLRSLVDPGRERSADMSVSQKRTSRRSAGCSGSRRRSRRTRRPGGQRYARPLRPSVRYPAPLRVPAHARRSGSRVPRPRRGSTGGPRSPSFGDSVHAVSTEQRARRRAHPARAASDGTSRPPGSARWPCYRACRS